MTDVKKVFISYNYQDAAAATRLALDLEQTTGIRVFIDHWDMSVGDSLLERIEQAIDDSSFLLVLISSHSVDSKWVRTELGYAYLREEAEGRTFILPILLDDCKPPIHVAGRRYADYRTESDRERGFQYVLNAIRGGKVFSQLVAELIKDGCGSSEVMQCEAF